MERFSAKPKSQTLVVCRAPAKSLLCPLAVSQQVGQLHNHVSLSLCVSAWVKKYLDKRKKCFHWLRGRRRAMLLTGRGMTSPLPVPIVCTLLFLLSVLWYIYQCLYRLRAHGFTSLSCFCCCPPPIIASSVDLQYEAEEMVTASSQPTDKWKSLEFDCKSDL